MFFVLLCCCLAALYQGVLSGNEFHVNDTNKLIQFSKDVNSGKTYKGVTIFLDADIDFSGGLSEQFEPIGKNSSKYFQGTFDGQGHTISNLAINSSLQRVGLFGYTRATIRNVVLDSSCSVASSFSDSSDVYVGGIIGQCSDCTIENTVNMASVSFTGNTSYDLYLGGIVGYLYSSNNDIIVRNCANYGSVTHSGTADNARIGGIAGVSQGSSSIKYIQNCLNYGAITYSGTTGTPYIGGFLGYASGTNIFENCVSGGKITSNKEDSYYIGSVVGGIGSSSSTTTVSITHCYWSSDVVNYNASGSGSATIDNETKEVTLNATTVNDLNSYNSSWSKWLLNTNNKIVTFKVNNGKGFDLSSQLILLPSLAESENHTFSGWFEDEDCMKEFTSSSVNDEIVLYGGWSYTITFVFGNGTTATKNVVYGQEYGELPNATRTGYMFDGWFTEKEEGKGEKVTENDTVTKGFDHTLYAHWVINNYTLTFNFGNGTVVNEILEYNETVVYPVNPTREGCAFSGWEPKLERMPADDTIVVAQWTESTTEYVEIVFGKKGMTEEELKEIIKKYTDEEFTIERIETDKDTGETRITIRFKDKDATVNFVDKVRESSDSVAKIIRFVFEKQNSFSIETKLNMLAKLMFFFI